MRHGKLLILGRDGMLGSTLCEEARQQGLDFIVTSRVKPRNDGHISGEQVIEFDAVDDEIETLLSSNQNISHVVNCIGIVKQSKQATNDEYMTNVNGKFPIRLGSIAKSNGIKVIHLSTDCVFSGTKGNYSESDIPDPNDSYGLSKLVGEKIVKDDAMVIRTSMVGREVSSYKKGLVEWFLSMRGKQVQGYKNVFFSGLTTRRLSRMILDLVHEDKVFPGIWHISSERISKFDLLCRINARFDLGIEIMASEEPFLDRSLNSSKSSRLLGAEIPNWDSMLSDEDWSKAIEARV